VTILPNRIIKESIRESYSIDQLSQQSEVLFYRLITYADDYGLFKCDPRLINKALFPLKNYRESQVILWMDEIAKAGMITYYVGNDEKPYGLFKKWAKFQVARNIKPKYPQPDGVEQFTEIKNLLKSIEINCNQLKANVTVIQSNPNPNPNPNPKEKRRTFSRNDDEFILSKFLLDLILKNQPDHKYSIITPNLQNWASSIEKMIRIDKRDPSRIREVIKWCQEDNFWKGNILSTNKLREKYDKLNLQLNNGKDGLKNGPGQKKREGTERFVGFSDKDYTAGIKTPENF
jgi:hypothetical protein